MNALKQIVDGGYCIGCGVCSCATNGVVPVTSNEYGMYQADLSKVGEVSDEALRNAEFGCPFSDGGPDENVIGKTLFGEFCQHDSRIGYYKDLYVGHVNEDDFRAIGTSGGVITWVLAELFKRGEVDAVVHVKKVDDPCEEGFFKYGISRSIDEIKNGAKSRYYPVELSDVLKQMKQSPGRYAVVGLPCFIKAVRRLAEVDSEIRERVAFCIGLVCGHLKSKAFADCFGWQVGIEPGQLDEIDFRVKLPDRPAGRYGVYLEGGGREVTRPSLSFFGANWGYNFFRYSACNYCDDVFTETSDMVVGDAWLPGYSKDPLGNSVVVVRNEKLSSFIQQANKDGRLGFCREPVDVIAASQAGGVRDRREGLAYRLYLKEKKGDFSPTKRIDAERAGQGLTLRRKQIYLLRMKMEQASHKYWRKAKSRADYRVFRRGVLPFVVLNKLLYPHKLRWIYRQLKGFGRKMYEFLRGI